MVKVIVNADDLGKDPVINKAIGEALAAGIISSATIMANSTLWDEIHSIVDKNPQASFGVHLNLTEGTALTHNPILLKYGVVDDDNIFTKKIKELSTIPEELGDALLIELEAQYKKVAEDEKITVSHIDSHHHIHTKDVLLPTILELTKKRQIRAMRIRYNEPLCFTFLRPFYKKRAIANTKPNISQTKSSSKTTASSQEKRQSTPLNSIYNIALGLVDNAKWRRKVKKLLITPDYFSTYESACYNLSIGMRYPSSSIVELMCHPGHVAFEKEMQMVRLGLFNNSIDCIMISYKDI